MPVNKYNEAVDSRSQVIGCCAQLSRQATAVATSVLNETSAEVKAMHY